MQKKLKAIEPKWLKLQLPTDIIIPPRVLAHQVILSQNVLPQGH